MSVQDPLVKGAPSSKVSPRGEYQAVEAMEANGEDDPAPARKLAPDDVLNFIGLGRFQVLTFFLTGLLYLAYGMDASVWVFIGLELQDTWGLSNLEYALGLATTSIPNVAGVIVFSFLSDNFGRVWPFALTLVFCIVGGLASAFAPNYLVFIALRWIASFGIGGVGVLTFPTLVEVLPVRNRGKMVTLMIVLPAIGLAMSAGLAWWLMPNYPHHGWRYFMIATSLPSVIAVAYRLVFNFESPRFLIVKGKLDKAWSVLSSMAWINGVQLTDFMTKDEFCETFSHKQATGSNSKLRSVIQIFVIFRWRYLRRTLCLTVLILTESFGYMGSTVFLPQYLADTLHQNPYFSLFVACVAQIPGIVFMSIIVEWPGVGRLNALRFFSLMVVIFFLLFAFIQTRVTIPVFLVFLYFCMIPILSLIYTYVNESYPTNIRARGNGYFYSLQLMSSLVYPFLGEFIEGFHITWLYPVFWACLFSIQLVAGLILNYEPYGRKLMDTVE